MVSTNSGVIRLRQDSKHVSVKRSVILIQWRFTPTSWMESPLRTRNKHTSVCVRRTMTSDAPFRNWCIQTWNTESGVTRWRSKTLHADEPGRGCKWWNRQGLNKFSRKISRSFFFQRRLELFPFIVPVQESQNK